jgi:hypothetical protein
MVGGCGGAANSAGRDAGDALDAGLKFARCMREHGVNMPDPQPDKGGRLQFRASAGGRGKDAPQSMDAAEKACQKYLDGIKPKLTPEREQEMRDNAVRFSACMRRHGVDIPDPEFDGGGIKQRVGGPGSDVDPESPVFRKAEEACGDLRPSLGRTTRKEP